MPQNFSSLYLSLLSSKAIFTFEGNSYRSSLIVSTEICTRVLQRNWGNRIFGCVGVCVCIYIGGWGGERYYKELVHVIMEADKPQDLQGEHHA